MRCKTLTVVSLLSIAASASASIHGVTDVLSTLDGNGDRTIDSISFLGSPTVMTPGTVKAFVDGNLSYGNSYYGWTGAAPRDMNTSGNAYPGNPDRADHSSPYAGEGSSTGTLAEIFGVNNASHIIDGEGNGWAIELYFAHGDTVKDDHDASTVEFAIFERGWNSSIGIQGIYEDGIGDDVHFTSPVILTPEDFTYAGWKINTLEIADDQKVVGAGLSVEAFGDTPGEFIGFRVFAEAEFGGPDIVAIRAQNNLVPTPGAAGLLAMLAVGAGRRRR